MTRGVPSDQTREGWWYHASQEEKLAQIDAAISLGLTAAVVARNCGANAWTVQTFANFHKRHFMDGRYGTTDEPTYRPLTPGEEKRLLRKAYFSGEPVMFGGR